MGEKRERTPAELHALYDAMLDAGAVHENARNRFLDAMGWRHTCGTPGSWWLWVNPGQPSIMVERSLAVSMATAMLPYVPDEDEDGPD